MSSDYSNQESQRDRSPSAEINDPEIHDDAAAPQQQQEPIQHTTLLAPDFPGPQVNRAAVNQFLHANRGREHPPLGHAQMNMLVVGQQDLTQLYGAQYPALDYPYSFAAGSMPLLPPADRDRIGGLHPALRTQPRAPTVVTHPRPQQAPATAAMGPGPAQQGYGWGTLRTAPTNPTTPSTSQSPASNSATTPAARPPGETQRDGIQRLHSLDIDDRSIYIAGSGPIPQEVQDLVDRIKGFKKNPSGYPMRIELKTIEDHFMRSHGKLRTTSWLWQWYGDGRLFTREEWYYLVTEGVGKQVPL